MNLDRITEYEESLLSDTCTVYPQSVSISAGIPVKSAAQGVSASCLVCKASTQEKDAQGVYGAVSSYLVKLPRALELREGDVITWNDKNLVVSETNRGNTWRVLTVATCKEQL